MKSTVVTDNSWTCERHLKLRLIHESIDLDEIRQMCIDMTKLPEVLFAACDDELLYHSLQGAAFFSLIHATVHSVHHFIFLGSNGFTSADLPLKTSKLYSCQISLNLWMVNPYINSISSLILKGHSHEKIHMFFWLDSVKNIK